MSDAAQRALARSKWPVRKVEGPAAELASVAADGQSGWDAVTELSWECYALAGALPPAIPRAQWPSRLFKPGEARPDSNGL